MLWGLHTFRFEPVSISSGHVCVSCVLVCVCVRVCVCVSIRQGRGDSRFVGKSQGCSSHRTDRVSQVPQQILSDHRVNTVDLLSFCCPTPLSVYSPTLAAFLHGGIAQRIHLSSSVMCLTHTRVRAHTHTHTQTHKSSSMCTTLASSQSGAKLY